MEKRIDKFRGEYVFLSNFYYCQIIFEGGMYPSAEHLYQSMKMENSVEADIIRKADSAATAKKFGNSFKAKPNWNNLRLAAMKSVVRLKFNQNLVLRKKLIRTWELTLVEGNYWHDNFWGVCECPDCKDAIDEIGYENANHLGKILMVVRKEILDGEI